MARFDSPAMDLLGASITLPLRWPAAGRSLSRSRPVDISTTTVVALAPLVPGVPFGGESIRPGPYGCFVAKHLLDETAEFAMPRAGRHAAPDTGELAVTQRFDPGFRQQHPVPARQRSSDEEAR